MASQSSSPFTRARLSTTLTSVQHVSALAFGTFLVVHLAAPSTAVVASAGNATDLASKTMILGRVYYQARLLEPVVVYGAAAVHVLAGLAKRCVTVYARWSNDTAKRRKGNEVEPYRIPDAAAAADDGDAADNVHQMAQTKKSTGTLFAWPSVHTVTGVLLAPALVVHVLLNRLVPARAHAPINELSPSEVDYSFVTYGLQTRQGTSAAWRNVTIAMYAILLGAGALHVVTGTDRIAQRAQVRRRRGRRSVVAPSSSTVEDVEDDAKTTRRSTMRQLDVRRARQRKTAVSVVVSLTGASWLAWGLTRMAHEESGVSGYMEKRVKAVYASVWPYSVL